MIKKALAVIFLTGLIVTAGNVRGAVVKALDDYCCSDKGGAPPPSCNMCTYSGTCQNVPPNCGQEGKYGTCYCSYEDPDARCTSWGDWANCHSEGSSCYETRFCQAPPEYTYLYQIRQCGTPPDCGGGGGETDYVNCSDLTIDGEYTGGTMPLTKGTAYTLSASYDTAGKTGSWLMRIISGTSCGDYERSWSHAAGPGSGSYTFDWTPAQTGTYTVYCLSSATGYASCSGFGTCADGTDYTCSGPHAKMTVNVVEPSCIPTDPAAVTLTWPANGATVAESPVTLDWNATSRSRLKRDLQSVTTGRPK